MVLSEEKLKSIFKALLAISIFVLIIKAVLIFLFHQEKALMIKKGSAAVHFNLKEKYGYNGKGNPQKFYKDLLESRMFDLPEDLEVDRDMLNASPSERYLNRLENKMKADRDLDGYEIPFTVEGIISGQARGVSVAILKMRDKEERVYVKKGESVDGWQIKRIRPAEVLLMSTQNENLFKIVSVS